MSQKSAVDYFTDTFKEVGAAASTVSDGHVIMLSRKMLQGLMDNNPDKSEFLIFLKRQTFEN